MEQTNATMKEKAENVEAEKPTHAKPSLYAFYFEAIKAIGLKYGYNIVLHGSMNRDLDLIAIPWEEKVGDILKMIKEIADTLGGFILSDASREKPHGRFVYVVNINRTIDAKYDGMVTKVIEHTDPQFYIDISVIQNTLTTYKEGLKRKIEIRIEKCEEMIFTLQGTAASSFYEGRVIELKSALSLIDKPTICKHKNNKREDGLDECLDCGVRNY